MTKETKEQLMEKVQFLLDHAKFYYEQRCETEPFLKNDYPFDKWADKTKKEIEKILKQL